MTERNLNLGSITFTSGSSGTAHSSSLGYQSGTYVSTTSYATQWEHPQKYAEIEKYFKKVFKDDASKIISFFESNAVSLEDHLAAGYLAVDGGTVYGDVVMGKNLTVYDEIYIGTKPVEQYLCPIGTIIPYAGGTPLPASISGWLLCDGTAYLQTSYPGLNGIIGSTYNTTNGQTAPASGYFRVPDLRGMTIVGVNSGISDFNGIGKYGGQKTVTLGTNEMPAHTHGRQDIRTGGAATNPGNYISSGASTVYYTNGGSGYTADNLGTTSTGGGAAHENMPPYVVINYLIRA